MIIHDLEQGSEAWLNLRAGMPTGTGAKRLVTSTGQLSKSMSDYAIELAGDMFAGKPLDQFEGNQWTDRGIELEDSARSLYELVKDCEVKEVGFCTDDNDLYGMSPDGLVNDDGLAEFKCLKATNHIKARLYYLKHNKPEPDYIPQVQMQLFVSGRDWCDLVYFHPDLPELIIRIEADKDFHKVLEQQLHAVIKERDNIIKLLKEA